MVAKLFIVNIKWDRVNYIIKREDNLNVNKSSLEN